MDGRGKEGGGGGWGGVGANDEMMKLGTVKPYLKKIKKYMNHVTHP